MFSSSTPVKINTYTNSKNMENRLDKIIKNYQTKSNSDPITLRLQLSSNEIWRLFIDGVNQEYGRGLCKKIDFLKKAIQVEQAKKNQLFSYFNTTPSILDYKIIDYIEQIIKVDTSEKNWRYDTFLRDLPHHHWRLSDEQCKSMTLRDLVGLDRAWLPFEINEAGYMQAMYTAFDKIFKQTGLSVESINELHGLATHQVKATLYTDIDNQDKIGELRNSSTAGFGLKNNVTQAGLEGIIIKDAPWNYFNIQIAGNRAIKFNTETISFLQQNYQFLYPEEPKDNEVYQAKWKELLTIFSYYSEEDAAYLLTDIQNSLELKKLFSAAKDKDVKKIAESLFSLIKDFGSHYSVSLRSNQPHDTQMTLIEIINTLIQQYQLSINNATSSLEKLRAIITLTQSLEQLHPYIDGNCRTICMLLFNELLINNGFPLAILDDPNRFDAHSVEEMLREVIEGMENTYTLLETGKLHNISTHEIISFLENRNFIAELSHFYTVIGIEESNTHLSKLRENGVRCELR